MNPLLLAEDEESDMIIFRQAARRAGILNPLVHVRDGQEVIDYLDGTATRPRPAIIFLDLKMPRMTGLETLAWLKCRPELASIPVIVLSSSPDKSDIQRATDSGAAEYHVKPHGLNELVILLKILREKWLPDPAMD